MSFYDWLSYVHALLYLCRTLLHWHILPIIAHRYLFLIICTGTKQFCVWRTWICTWLAEKNLRNIHTFFWLSHFQLSSITISHFLKQPSAFLVLLLGNSIPLKSFPLHPANMLIKAWVKKKPLMCLSMKAISNKPVTINN